MESFNNIGCIHDSADVFVVLKIATESWPVLSPGFDHLGISGTPVRFQLIKTTLCLVSGTLDRSQLRTLPTLVPSGFRMPMIWLSVNFDFFISFKIKRFYIFDRYLLKVSLHPVFAKQGLTRAQLLQCLPFEFFVVKFSILFHKKTVLRVLIF
ncbi:hypothetical protein SAMN04488128_108176 [Chitinophaga eiseniae]|uniref:Uncharacterized protein n=1 Tax=Chitinophaga eiseniae TaxID=634771 RepID=A0A1T4U3N8_9BACT|nr:hypothetical protein SAMN04488128_108176 [Chitinophaga eiseniae]